MAIKPPPTPLDVSQLIETLRTCGLESVEASYPLVYGGLDHMPRLELVRFLREHGFSHPVVAAVLGVSVPTAKRYALQSGAEEPRNTIGADGAARVNAQYTGKPRKFKPLQQAGRPVSARADLLLNELRTAAARLAKIDPQDIPPPVLDEVDRVVQLTYNRDQPAPAGHDNYA